KRFGIRALFVPHRNLLLILPHQPPVLAGASPSRGRHPEQKHRRRHQQGHDAAPAQPELPRILVGLCCQIDIDAHQETKAPTIPAIRHLGTSPIPAPNRAESTSSFTSAPVCALKAGAAPSESDNPATKICPIFKL